MESKYIYRRVAFADLLWRGLPLIEKHTAMHGSDLVTYLREPKEWAKHEAAGSLLLTEAVDARTDATVGYIIWGIAGHPLFPDQLVAKMGPYYVDPPHRRATSRRLFEHSLDLLRERGLRWAMPTLPIRDHRKRSRTTMFGRPIETTFILDLRSSHVTSTEHHQTPNDANEVDIQKNAGSNKDGNSDDDHYVLILSSSNHRTLAPSTQEVNP